MKINIALTVLTVAMVLEDVEHLKKCVTDKHFERKKK